MSWDRDKIRSVLPHREPFLFIDEVVEIIGTEKVVAAKHTDRGEEYFRGHFPGNPVMPGVLIIEAMAQASIILYFVAKPDIANTHPDYYLGRVKTEFIAPVYPGDTLILEVSSVKILDNAAITDAIARVNDTIVAKASLVFGIKKGSLE